MKKLFYFSLSAFLITSCSKKKDDPAPVSPTTTPTPTPTPVIITPTPVKTIDVTTFAGSGSNGSTDATGASASFYRPLGVAVDVSGNVYVADVFNNKIRKISATGVVTTFAGSGTQGSANGTGSAASFYYPFGIAVDASGNVYVADNFNNKIRKITPSGVVSTLAGSGSKGSSDGIGSAASFNGPSDVAVDASGNVYVADASNNKIRKISTSGVVTTLAGSGTSGNSDGLGSSASFSVPAHLAVDASGNVYVSDGTSNNKIRKITPAGAVSTFAGSGLLDSQDGTATEASFYFPAGLTVDGSGNLYVADSGNNKIRKITPAGVVSTLAGSGSFGSSDGKGTLASFKNPSGITIDASGNLYISDTDNNKIRKITQ